VLLRNLESKNNRGLMICDVMVENLFAWCQSSVSLPHSITLTTSRWSCTPVPLAICSTVRRSRLYALALYRLFRLTCRCSWWSVKRRLFRKSMLRSLHFLPTDQERLYILLSRWLNMWNSCFNCKEGALKNAW